MLWFNNLEISRANIQYFCRFRTGHNLLLFSFTFKFLFSLYQTHLRSWMWFLSYAIRMLSSDCWVKALIFNPQEYGSALEPGKDFKNLFSKSNNFSIAVLLKISVFSVVTVLIFIFLYFFNIFIILIHVKKFYFYYFFYFTNKCIIMCDFCFYVLFCFYYPVFLINMAYCNYWATMPIGKSSIFFFVNKKKYCYLFWKDKLPLNKIFDFYCTNSNLLCMIFYKYTSQSLVLISLMLLL